MARWKEFVRIVGAVFFVGMGITVALNSGGETIKLILAFLFVGIGIALLTYK